MKLLNRLRTAGWIMVAFLLVSAYPALAGGADAKKHSAEMMEAADKMVDHGSQGHMDVLIKHAKEMVMHGQAAVKAIPPGDPHGKEAKMHINVAIEEAEGAIDHGSQGHGSIAMKHARAAQSHGEEGNMHMQEVK